MKYTPLPPLEELKEFLDYNPDTGIFTWIKPRSGSRLNQVAGNLHLGYIRITFKYEHYRAHRLAYYMYYGIDPLEKLIDHIDGDKSNNKIKNLRLATKSQNNMNRISLGINNTSGISGVSWHKNNKNWRARIQLNGVAKHLGCFTNKEDAIKARKEAEIKYFGDFRSKD